MLRAFAFALAAILLCFVCYLHEHCPAGQLAAMARAEPRRHLTGHRVDEVVAGRVAPRGFGCMKTAAPGFPDRPLSAGGFISWLTACALEDSL